MQNAFRHFDKIRTNYDVDDNKTSKNMRKSKINFALFSIFWTVSRILALFINLSNKWHFFYFLQDFEKICLISETTIN